MEKSLLKTNMWIAHFGPALVAKRFAPQVDPFLLALAGSLPDALFFVLAILGVEEIKYSDKSEKKGYVNFFGGRGSSCFPYVSPSRICLIGDA